MSSPSPMTLLVPGNPEQLTGGYVYNQRIAKAIRASGRGMDVRGLDGQFPETDAVAVAAAEKALSGLPDDAQVLVDGLALGGLADTVARHRQRLRILALIHHPLADETGLAPEQALRLRASETRALAQVRGIITTSAFTARRLADFQVEPARLRVVEPGCEPAPLAIGSRPEPALLCVATLVPRKGQDLLVEALSRLTDLPWRCYLVGSTDRAPAFAAKVRALIAQFGLGERVLLEGEQAADQLADFYHRANLFVLPSHYEGYGMVITEALARGLPVITTTGGALQFTLPDQAGIKVPPDSVDALTQALRRTLSEPAQLEEMAAGARTARAGLQRWDEAGAQFFRAVDELTAADTHARSTAP